MVANEGQKWLTSGQSWLIGVLLLENRCFKIWLNCLLFGKMQMVEQAISLPKLGTWARLGRQARSSVALRQLLLGDRPITTRFPEVSLTITNQLGSQSVTSLVSSPLTACVLPLLVLIVHDPQPHQPQRTVTIGAGGVADRELQAAHLALQGERWINGGWRMVNQRDGCSNGRGPNIHHQWSWYWWISG